MREYLGAILKDFTVSLNFSIAVFTVASYSSAVLVMLGGGGEVALGWENLGWLLRPDFINFFFACLEATEPISRIFTFVEIFTILKGLEMFSSPDMTVRSYLLQVSLSCFGMTVRSSRLKSYKVILEIASDVRTLVARSSAPSPVSFAYRKCETRLRKSDKLISISGRIRLKIVPNFVWRPHCRKAGWLSEEDHRIYAIML